MLRLRLRSSFRAQPAQPGAAAFRAAAGASMGADGEPELDEALVPPPRALCFATLCCCARLVSRQAAAKFRNL